MARANSLRIPSLAQQLLRKRKKHLVFGSVNLSRWQALQTWSVSWNGADSLGAANQDQLEFP